MEGWVKLYRKLSEKAFYSKDSEMVHLWIHLLISANHKEREEYFGGKPIICQPGQFTTGRNQLVEATGINRSKIERILQKLEKNEHQIEQQTSNVNRLITILNWSEYQQDEQQYEQQVSNDRATSEQQVSTLQECKECKECKKEDSIDKPKKFNFKKSLIELGVNENIVSEYLQIRKSKKAINTETAFKSIKSEIEKTNYPANDCIQMAVKRSWAGFEAEWYLNALSKSKEAQKSQIQAQIPQYLKNSWTAK